jgi:hypothetical protein
MSESDLIESFTLEGISGRQCRVQLRATRSVSGQYIGRLAVADHAMFERLLALLRPRAKQFTDFVEQAAPLFARPGRLRAGHREAPVGATTRHQGRRVNFTHARRVDGPSFLRRGNLHELDSILIKLPPESKSRAARRPFSLGKSSIQLWHTRCTTAVLKALRAHPLRHGPVPRS